MSLEREYTDYLRDIVDAAEKAERFLGDMDLAAFLADEKTSFAVVRALGVIGEAAKHIPQSVRRMHQEVPWPDMAGMRDKLIHGCFGVNLKRAYETARRELPALRKAIVAILTDLARGRG